MTTWLKNHSFFTDSSSLASCSLAFNLKALILSFLRSVTSSGLLTGEGGFELDLFVTTGEVGEVALPVVGGELTGGGGGKPAAAAAEVNRLWYSSNLGRDNPAKRE